MNRLKKKISKRHSRTKRRHRRTVYRGGNAQDTSTSSGSSDYLPTWLTDWYSSSTKKEPTPTNTTTTVDTTSTTITQPESINIPTPPLPSSDSTAVVSTFTENTPATTTVGGGRRYRHKKTTKRGKCEYCKKTMKKHRRY